MASVTLGTLRDYWKNVSQWVTGTSTSVPVIKESEKQAEYSVISTAVTVPSGSNVRYNIGKTGVGSINFDDYTKIAASGVWTNGVQHEIQVQSRETSGTMSPLQAEMGSISNDGYFTYKGEKGGHKPFDLIMMNGYLQLVVVNNGTADDTLEELYIRFIK